MCQPASKTFPLYVYVLSTYGRGSHSVKSEYSRWRTTNQRSTNKLIVLGLVFGISIWKGKEKLIIIISATEMKQEIFYSETKGCKLEGRRNHSFSSRRFRNAFLFSEIIIKLNVNLITWNQLSDIGKAGGAASPGWQGPICMSSNLWYVVICEVDYVWCFDPWVVVRKLMVLWFE